MSAGSGTEASAEGAAISLPKGGGAIAGIGETFSADPFTGTGSFSVPIDVLPGRNGLAPKLGLAYSSGNGTGVFGLGWAMSLPRVSRKTSHGVPTYGDGDTFLLSGAEDLVPVSGTHPGRVRYRPRTEGLFARIDHVRDATGDHWEVRGRDGLRTRYGTPRPSDAGPDWRDPAATHRPNGGSPFAWEITETVDPLGNRIRYTYRSDQDQPLLARVEYADYGDREAPSFLAGVEFEYEDRPDAYTHNRAGFAIRTAVRCRLIRVVTRAGDGVRRVVREYRLGYTTAPFNGASLLSRVEVVGIDGTDEEHLAPLTFEYTTFTPAGRRFAALTGAALPAASLTDPGVALLDLNGNGLPDVVELGRAPRFWSNRGGGRFELPRQMEQAPSVALGSPGVDLLDADGDGRVDLLVSDGQGPTGYFPLNSAGRWSRRSFRPYPQAPAVALAGNGVRFVDLDGDGLTDVLRSGERLDSWFNDPDPRRAWRRRSAATAPRVDLDDPRVRLADMTGDGLQDLVLLHDRSVVYWPNLGHGRWGEPVRMRTAPHLPTGYDPRRLLLGDVDGDGAADLVYVDHGRVLLWGNRSGTAWTAQPVVVSGTPAVADSDGVQLVDLYASGMVGLLWSSVRGRPAFLDFTGGVKPYLLSTMDGHMGARTTVRYEPSTAHLRRDQADPATRWRTPLPFPVQVVSAVEVHDQISGGRLTTEYRYRHGYWDGREREFRGFAMVEQVDTETFDIAGLNVAALEQYSPPVRTRSWFHVGPVAAVETDEWVELDLRHEYWAGDASMLERPAEVTALLAGLPRGARRDALRALRGRLLRSEVYADDGTGRAGRPYTVTESLSGVREESPPGPGDDGRARIFFPFPVGERVTRHERGDDPMTSFTFPAAHDGYGFGTGTLSVAVPRGRDPMRPDPAATEPYLAIHTTTEFARRDDDEVYLVDRVSRTTTVEVGNDGRGTVPELRAAVLGGGPPAVHQRVVGEERVHYDGAAFTGLPLGELDRHGLPTRVEMLAFTEAFLDDLGGRPPYLDPAGVWPDEYPDGFRTGTAALAGHVRDGDRYYVVTSRRRYDVHDATRVPRGLVLSTMDPLGNVGHAEFDAHDLLPVRTTDSLGLSTTGRYDHRLLQLREITDANGNTTSATYSPAGFRTAVYVRGKDGTGDGAEPGVRVEHDPRAFADRGRPASVRTIRRVYHDTQTDVPAAGRDEVIVTVEYSDGFGRPLQTRTQAEDTLFGDPSFGGGLLPADQSAPVPPVTGRTRAPGDPDNVVVDGWRVYDNKGRVVERFEPFFATGWEFAAPGEAELGQKVTMRYDPRGNLVRTISPDGSEQRVVHGTPDDLADPDVFAPSPWDVYTYDANDNAGRTHGAVADAYRRHWNTPSSVEVDALGRTVRTVVRNGPDPGIDWFVTRSTHDIQGNLVAVTDALGRVALRHRFDLAGRRWRVDSIDAGRRDSVPDASGSIVEQRTGTGALMLRVVDTQRRPVRIWARDRADAPVTLRQLIEYGDGGDAGQPAEERAAARAHNLLGHPVRHFDGAGLVTVTEMDCKGNVLESERRVIADAPLLAAYDRAADGDWTVPAFQVDWAKPEGLLEDVGYRSSTRFDALDRMTTHLLPAGVDGQRHELRTRFTRAGALDQVLLDGTAYVAQIAHDAKGQRVLVRGGNGVLTRYAYDPHTFRLVRLRSERGRDVLQDHAYDHDPAGNLLRLRDRTPGCGLPKSPNALDRTFTYDPAYRLLTATGRETDTAPNGPPWTDMPRGTDVTRTRAYAESYHHNALGGLFRLVHASTGGFTREFHIDETSNRLRRLTDGTTPFDYTFDADGRLVTEAGSRHFGWDHDDRLVTFATRVAGAEPSLHAQYLYDAAGLRVKKLVRRQGGAVSVTHYLGTAFEHHRWTGGENDHVHVVDGATRVATVRIGAAHPDDHAPAVTYRLTDHLGSVTTVVDGAGAPVSREEYTPYGDTSFGGFARKRYRFTGRERDEESGLSYHGARYYAIHQGRWLSPDPAGPVDSLDLYLYARANPLTFTDIGGGNSNNEIDKAIRDANNRARVHTETGDKATSKATADAERAKAAKWKDEAAFLQNLKDVHEKQTGVPITHEDGRAYSKYPVTTKGTGPDVGWQYSAKPSTDFDPGEAAGSFCAGTSRGMAVRATFGLGKPSYFTVLTDNRATIVAAQKAGDKMAEAKAVISRIVSHQTNDKGSVNQFNADLGDRYGITNVKFKSANWKEATAALDAGAPVVASVAGGSHWVMVSKSPKGQLWANDPSPYVSGPQRFTPDQLHGRFEIIVDATTNKPITRANASTYEKKP